MGVKCLIVSALVVAGCLFATPAGAHTVLAEKGKPKGRIIVATHHAVDEQAALLLQDFVRRPWHYGVGHPCWFFIDEVAVK